MKGTRTRRQFATLQRVRSHQERIEAQKLAVFERRVLAAEAQRAALAAQQQLAIDNATEAAGRLLDVHRVRSYLVYERQLADLAVRKDAEIRQHRDRANRQRSVLEEAIKRRRMMDRLLERYDKARILEERRLEQRLSDETAAIRSAAASETYGP